MDHSSMEQPTNITDMYSDLMIKIISNLSIRDICGFMSLSKWTQSFDCISGWRNIMRCKGLDEELYALQSETELIINELVKMCMRESFCSLAIPKNKSIRGLIKNHETFADVIGHEFGKIYNELLARPEIRDEKSIKSYFDSRPINIYKLYLVCTTRHFEITSELINAGSEARSIYLFGDDPLILEMKKKNAKTRKPRFMEYGNKQHYGYKSYCNDNDQHSGDTTENNSDLTASKNTKNTFENTLDKLTLKKDLEGQSEFKKHKSIYRNYKYKYDLCNWISPENRLNALKFDSKLINYIENPSDEEIKIVAKTKPKSLLMIKIQSEELQLYVLKKMSKKLPSGKLLKFLRNPTQAAIKYALDKNMENIRYIFPLDKIIETFKQNPSAKLFMHIVQNNGLNPKVTNEFIMVCPEVIKFLRKPPLETIYIVLEQDTKNIKYIDKEHITQDLIDWYCHKQLNLDDLVEKHPFVINLIPREELKKFLLKNPKALKEFLEKQSIESDEVDKSDKSDKSYKLDKLLQELLHENRKLVIEVYCSIYGTINLIKSQSIILFGSNLCVEDFINNNKLYLKLEKDISNKINALKKKDPAYKNNEDKEQTSYSIYSPDSFGSYGEPQIISKQTLNSLKGYQDTTGIMSSDAGKCQSCECIDAPEGYYSPRDKTCDDIPELENMNEEQTSNSETPEDNYPSQYMSRYASPKTKKLDERIKKLKKQTKNSPEAEKYKTNTADMIINIRKAVIDKHPYLLSYVVANREYPVGFKDSQTYKDIITNAIKKYPAMIEIFDNVPEEYQTQAIICSPECAGNLNVKLSKKAQELALVMNPYETIKRIHLDDDVIDKSAIVNPYQFNKVKNLYTLDAIHRRRMFLAKQLLPSEFFNNKDYISSVKNIENLAEAGYNINGKRVHIIKKSLLNDQQLDKIIDANAKFAEKLLMKNHTSSYESMNTPMSSSVASLKGLLSQVKNQENKLKKILGSKVSISIGTTNKNSNDQCGDNDDNDKDDKDNENKSNENNDSSEDNDSDEDTTSTKGKTDCIIQ